MSKGIGIKKSSIAAIVLLAMLAYSSVLLPRQYWSFYLTGTGIKEPGYTIGHQHHGMNLLKESLRLRTLKNDQTIHLSPHVERPWLYYNSDTFLSNVSRKNIQLPKQKLILTDIGWNHPNKKKGLTFTRSIRARELLQAYVDHTNYDPTFNWSYEMDKAKAYTKNGTASSFDSDVHYIVMMDIETCFESNYPLTCACFEKNADIQDGRLVTAKGQNPCYGLCHGYIQKILESPLFLQHPGKTSLLYYECRGNGIEKRYREERNTNPNLYIFTISSASNQLISPSDTGSPPPASRVITLSYQQREATQNCDESERPYFYTFLGSISRSQARKDLGTLHNGKDVLVMDRGNYIGRYNVNETYEALLYKTIFAGTPRGDNLFSYRFTEVMSSASIPVVHADNWVLPFHHKLVDWKKCVVTIEEAKANETMAILKKISAAKRCEMRQYCYSIYQKYFANPNANIAGMIDSIEMARTVASKL